MRAREVQRSKTVGRDSTSSLFFRLLLLKGKNRQRKRGTRSRGRTGTAAAPWQSHRSHTEKPHTRGPAYVCTDGQWTTGRTCLPVGGQSGERARGMSFLVTAPETDALPAVTSDKPQESGCGYHAPRGAEVE